MLLKRALLILDTPTAHGRIYPKAVMEKAIENCQKAIKNRTLLGTIDTQFGNVQLDQVSHIITDIKIEGNTVIGEIEILNTSEGKRLQDMINKGRVENLSLEGTATIGGDGVVGSDYEIMNITIEEKR